MLFFRGKLLVFFSCAIVLLGCQVEAAKPLGKSSKKPQVTQEAVKVEKKEQQQLEQEQLKHKEQQNREEIQYAREITSLQNKPIIFNGSKHKRQVALTFDDGPDGAITPEVLDILKQERVIATFFVVGQWCEKNPAVLRRIDQEGHVIGNHSWNHPSLNKLSPSHIDTQLQKTNQAISKVIRKEPTLFRPPYGATNPYVVKRIRSHGFQVINWNIDTEDWRGKSSKQIMMTVTHQMMPGSIILQHSRGNKLRGSVDALRPMIQYLKKKGYEFVTVDQLLQVPAYKITPLHKSPRI